MTVSAIIVNWRTFELTRQAVESVLNQEFDGGVEVIVVDNASGDGSAERLAALPGIRLIAAPRNLGFAGGNNLGLRRAHGEFTLLLNSDAALAPGALAALVAEARAHPEAGAIGPRVIYPDGRVQYTWDYVPSLRNELWLVLAQRRRIASARWQAAVRAWAAPRPIRAVQLAALLVPMRVWRRLGLLATEPFLYFEDCDLSVRLARGGYAMRYVPAAQVVHHEGQSSGQVPRRRRAAHYASRIWFYERHRDRCSAGLVRFLSAARASLGLALARDEAEREELWRPILRSARKERQSV